MGTRVAIQTGPNNLHCGAIAGTLAYRREIDGLRALAVIPVILFHAGFASFSGGFVGVDVFFVISGYLITSIILTEISAGTFSFANFYERRARRILPALFFMILICLPLAWLWMLPNELAEFAQSVSAISLFSSNILFWQQSGYFEADATAKPLLHTWSIAVEEQYYLFFPMFIMAFWFMGRRWLTGVIIAVGLISLGLAEWGTRSHPTANYYLLPTRAWELLAGSLTALYLIRQDVNQTGNNALSIIGAGLIAYAVGRFDETLPFPGLYALAPVVGTVMIIIYAKPGTLCARLLSTPLLVGIGLISYSTYLWHQPLFAFAKTRSPETVSEGVMALLALTAVILGWLSWRIIERPFRNKTRISRPQIFTGALAGSFILLMIGLAGNLGNGFPARSAGTADIASAATFKIPKHCRRLTSFSQDCLFGVPGSDQPDAIVWGDSYANALLGGLDRALADANLTAAPAIYFSCPSILGVTRNDARNLGANFEKNCARYTKRAFKRIAASTVRTVIMTSAYLSYTTDTNSEGEPLLETNGSTSRLSRENDIIGQLKSTVIGLTGQGKHVILVLPHPRAIGFDAAFKRQFQGEPASFRLNRRQADDLSSRIRRALAGVTSVDFVAPTDIFCKSDDCRFVRNGKFLLADRGHLSRVAARQVSAQIIGQLNKK